MARLNSSGGQVWNTFLGGNGNEQGNAIALDGSGGVYLSGDSTATWGSPKRVFSAGSDAFAAKLSSAGQLQWNTFLGSANNEYGLGVAADGAGNSYLTGYGKAAWGPPVSLSLFWPSRTSSSPSSTRMAICAGTRSWDPPATSRAGGSRWTGRSTPTWLGTAASPGALPSAVSPGYRMPPRSPSCTPVPSNRSASRSPARRQGGSTPVTRSPPRWPLRRFAAHHIHLVGDTEIAGDPRRRLYRWDY